MERSRIVRWDLESGKELPVLEWQEGAITRMAFSPDGRKLALAIGDYTEERTGRLAIWQIESRKPERTLNLTSGREAIECLVFSPDGKYLAAGCSDRLDPKNTTILCWDTTPAWTLWKKLDAGRFTWITGLAFSADGKVLAASDAGVGPFWDRRAMIRLWNMEGYTTLQCNLIGHDANILALTFLPDGTLVSAGKDATVKHWVEAAKQVRMVTSVTRTIRNR
jgi:WD40 repeat protein